MIAVDRDDEPSDAIAALEATVDQYKRDNAQLAARVAELERQDADLRPLKALLASDSEYERARRGWKSGLLQVLAAARIRGFSVEDGRRTVPRRGRQEGAGDRTPARGHGFRSNGRLQIPVAFRVGDEIGARGCGAGYADV
jgi:hypothetical protein